MRCEGLTGTHRGIIGAVSAIGLHRAGNDGRFLWLPGLRELKGKYQVSEVCKLGHIDRVCTLNNSELQSKSIVDVGEWIRPVLRDGQATIYVGSLGIAVINHFSYTDFTGNTEKSRF